MCKPTGSKRYVICPNAYTTGTVDDQGLIRPRRAAELGVAEAAASSEAETEDAPPLVLNQRMLRAGADRFVRVRIDSLDAHASVHSPRPYALNTSERPYALNTSDLTCACACAYTR